jgi:hypothetical protein
MKIERKTITVLVPKVCIAGSWRGETPSRNQKLLAAGSLADLLLGHVPFLAPWDLSRAGGQIREQKDISFRYQLPLDFELGLKHFKGAAYVKISLPAEAWIDRTIYDKIAQPYAAMNLFEYLAFNLFRQTAQKQIRKLMNVAEWVQISHEGVFDRRLFNRTEGVADLEARIKIGRERTGLFTIVMATDHGRTAINFRLGDGGGFPDEYLLQILSVTKPEEPQTSPSRLKIPLTPTR